MELRVSRHTNNLQPLIKFYSAVFNLEVLSSFQSRDNYDGVFLGKDNLDWHLEFTQSQ